MLPMFENSFNQGYVCDTFLVSYIEVFCGSRTNAANVASSVAVLVGESSSIGFPVLQC